MKKFLLAIVALVSATVMFAQNPLPVDPEIRIGKLDNGMTYYIRHNDQPAQRAEFYLATNVGAFQEAPDQDGLAHFLEHMCFNGTKNFPGKNLLNYLQSIGAEFGRNINASTGFEQTQYMLNNIPIVRESIIDSCLLIMHDYSHFVLCEPDEIDAERGVILEERRTRRDASWRMFEQILPIYLAGTPQEKCTLIGQEESLKTFKPESLVNFYKTWYQPDMQALVVVGDFDVDMMEGKIKTIFSDIPAPETPTVKTIYPFKESEEPVVAIITDPEAQGSSIEIQWQDTPMPKEMNNTDIGFMTEILKNYVYFIMAERLGDITASADAPFLSGSFSISKIFDNCESYMGSVDFKDGEAIPAFTAFMTEIEKMRRYGFNEGEVTRAKDNIISYYEKAAEAAATRKNAELVRPMINHFFYNKPLLDPAMQLQFAQAICSQINAALLTQAISQMEDKNIIIIYTAPDKAAHPTAEQLAAIVKDVRNAEIEANVEECVNEPFISKNLKGSKVKSVKENIFGGQTWVLKNGLKVHVLPTTYKQDQVLVKLYKKGGKSLISDEDMPSFEGNIWYLYLRNTGVSKFPSTTVQKMLSGKNLTVLTYINDLEHGISGNCVPKDLETCMQLMYLYFTEPRFDADEYAIGMNQINAVLPNMMNQPNYKLQEQIKNLSTKPWRNPLISPEVIEKANLETIEKNYRKLFNDVAGAEVVIVGNVDYATLKPMVEKYLGSLPKGKKASNWIDTENDFVPGIHENHFNVAMTTPKATVLQLYVADNMPYSVENTVALKAANFILDMIYTETLRESEGGTYGASSYMFVDREPKAEGLLQVYFDTNLESYAKLCELAKDGIRRLAEEGPTQEQFNIAVENLKKNLPESRITNNYWMDNIIKYSKYGEKYDELYEQAVNSLSIEKIKELMTMFYKAETFHELVMLPEAE